MNADDIRPDVEAVLDASLRVLDKATPGARGPYDPDCTDSAGTPSGRIRVGAVYDSHGLSRDTGIRNLQALQELWQAAGYRDLYPPRWDQPSLGLFFRDDDKGIRMSAELGGGGDFFVTVLSDCVEPGESATPSAAHDGPGLPAAPSVDEIRRVLG